MARSKSAKRTSTCTRSRPQSCVPNTISLHGECEWTVLSSVFFLSFENGERRLHQFHFTEFSNGSFTTLSIRSYSPRYSHALQTIYNLLGAIQRTARPTLASQTLYTNSGFSRLRRTRIIRQQSFFQKRKNGGKEEGKRKKTHSVKSMNSEFSNRTYPGCALSAAFFLFSRQQYQ